MFAIYPLGYDNPKRFLAHLNSLDEKIMFTMETEEWDKLQFLYVLITKNSNGTLGYLVSR